MLIAYEVVIKNQNEKIITRRISTEYINACQYFDKICKMYDVPLMTENEYVYNDTVSRTLDTNNDLELHEICIYENTKHFEFEREE